MLLAPAALPLPTGGVTHVFEVVAALVALQMIAGRREVWLPQRFQDRELSGSHRFIGALVRRIRWFERFSRPRWRWLFRRRITGPLLGVAVLGFTITAFLAPPFSGLDTLPALGVVVLSLAMLTEDAVLALVGLVIGVLGVLAAVFLSSLVVKGIGGLL